MRIVVVVVWDCLDALVSPSADGFAVVACLKRVRVFKFSTCLLKSFKQILNGWIVSRIPDKNNDISI